MMSVEMVIEDIELILNQGRCPRCGSPVWVKEDTDQAAWKCDVCRCQGLIGIGGDS